MIRVLVGMIASGKSTFAKESAHYGSIIVNDDDIVKMCHGGEYGLYDKKLKTLYKSVENTIVASALMLGRQVVVDRGVNVSARSRERWVALARSFDVPCQAVVFPKVHFTEHADRRFKHDPRGHDMQYWLDVAGHHDEQWEYPTLAEGFTSIKEIKK